MLDLPLVDRLAADDGDDRVASDASAGRRGTVGFVAGSAASDDRRRA